MGWFDQDKRRASDDKHKQKEAIRLLKQRQEALAKAKKDEHAAHVKAQIRAREERLRKTERDRAALARALKARNAKTKQKAPKKKGWWS